MVSTKHDFFNFPEFTLSFRTEERVKVLNQLSHPAVYIFKLQLSSSHLHNHVIENVRNLCQCGFIHI